MRFADFFSILTLFPVFISAGPVSTVRRDDASSLANDANNLMAVIIDIGRHFASTALELAPPSSVASKPLVGWQRVLQNQVTFKAFNGIINDLRCTYNLSMLMPPSGDPAFDEDILASLTWISSMTTIAADSIVANASTLDLSPASVDMIGALGNAANVMAMNLIPFTDAPIDPDDENQILTLANWEVYHIISLFQPHCTNDPGFEALDFPNRGTVLNTPFAPDVTMTIDMSSSCPNGENDTNCFCQTIAPNITAPLITPAKNCAMSAGIGMNTYFVTAGQDPISLEPGQRALQAAAGTFLDGPVPCLFGPIP